MKKINRPFILILYGPTGVGKTDISLAIARTLPAEIVNMDMGQFYTCLSIGTAKPDWKGTGIPHHLFDIIDEPVNCTVAEYRTIFYQKINEIIARGNLPIVVGGSGFYLYSLLFPQTVTIPDVDISFLYDDDTNLWDTLYSIDPTRALKIDKSDTYRIKRALGIWHATGTLPSSFGPTYHPSFDYLLVFLDRDRQELKKRIDDRVIHMLNNGWIAEAKKLIGTAWQPYLEKKNLIGYKEIFHCLTVPGCNSDAFDRMARLIRHQTNQYAKRQRTFWRKLEREIKQKSSYTGMYIGCLETVNLTDISVKLYVEELQKRLCSVGEKNE